MFKNILISLLFSASMYAQSFEILLKNALQKSAYVGSGSIDIQSAREQKKLFLRRENPELSLGVTSFLPQLGGSEFGTSIALEQNIELYGVRDTKERVAYLALKEIDALYKFKKSEYVKDFSLLYLDYKYKVLYTNLMQEEYALSLKIMKISHERYLAGSISKAKYLQSELDAMELKNVQKKSKIAQMQSYYKLLAFAGVQESVVVDTGHTFYLNKKNTRKSSFYLTYLKDKKERANAEVEHKKRKVSSVGLSFEMAQEPDQNIISFGVAFPLALFNQNSEEAKLAQLEAKKILLSINEMQKSLELEYAMLQESIEALSSLEQEERSFLTKYEELLRMHEDAYKIASIDLIELQLIKNRMLLAKKSALETAQKKEINIINYNFLLGENNE